MFEPLIKRVDLTEERPHEYDGSCLGGQMRYKFVSGFVDKVNNLILDIGCGEGHGLDFLLRKSKAMVGIDYSEDALNVAKDKFINEANISFIAMDAACLGFKNNIFGVVCACEVLEHLEKPKEMLSEIRRVLKDEGIFILTTPNKIYWDKLPEITRSPFHTEEYTYEGLKKILNTYFIINNFSGIFLKRKRIEESIFFNIYIKMKKILRIEKWRVSGKVRKILLGEKIDDYYVSNQNLENCCLFLVVCKKRNIVNT